MNIFEKNSIVEKTEWSGIQKYIIYFKLHRNTIQLKLNNGIHIKKSHQSSVFTTYIQPVKFTQNHSKYSLV